MMYVNTFKIHKSQEEGQQTDKEKVETEHRDLIHEVYTQARIILRYAYNKLETKLICLDLPGSGKWWRVVAFWVVRGVANAAENESEAPTADLALGFWWRRLNVEGLIATTLWGARPFFLCLPLTASALTFINSDTRQERQHEDLFVPAKENDFKAPNTWAYMSLQKMTYTDEN